MRYPLRVNRPSRAAARWQRWVRESLIASMVAMVLLVVAPAVGLAAIVPGYGIAGVKLDDSAAQVMAILGKPVTVQHNGGGEQNWLYDKNPVDWVTLIAKGGRTTVVGIETGDKTQKTPQGVGPGSSMAALQKAYPKLTCKKGSLGTAFLSCGIPTEVGGRSVATNFVLGSSGPVQGVDVGQIGERNLSPQP